MNNRNNRGQSINLYLIDGEPIGRIKCSLPNWTGVAYKIPRNLIGKCSEKGGGNKTYENLHHSGVYFLFGKDDETEKDVVYIGQAGVRKNGQGLLYRLQEHERSSEKNYWTEALCLTTSSGELGSTEISYLENRFCNLAKKASRYEVKNANEPNIGNVTEEKESELEEFIDYAKVVIGALGYKVLEPLAQKDSEDDKQDKNEELFYIKKRGADATCKITNEGFVVLSGSVISENATESCSKTALTKREDKNFVDEERKLKWDMLFYSPSGASVFVLGTSSNGNEDWKTKDGLSLGQVTKKLQ